MKYLVRIERVNNIIEEEVTVLIKNIELKCFTHSMNEEIEVGIEYYANIEYEIFDDFIVQEMDIKKKDIKNIKDKFSYIIYGKVDIEEKKIKSTIDIDINEFDSYVLSKFDNKYIKFKVDRFNIEFLKKIDYIF